ncbi:type II toxin-antitoxin system VapB family antitoxin [Rhizobium sp. BG4]|uniref:type II toxin-antitoxin system VapB family antitoxin n=1 Tax=Rhizobium sp. BG4 TaxID=2613770 RepID=UPI00193E9D65|nr:type II toxin-antitoxin system VapB family antitoxin [Rhizobium sp. BG4]QRM42749.1 transcription factor [Rhizobium sp. BG4]
MALYVKDEEVERLAKARRQTKTELLRQVLQKEIEREGIKPSLVEKGMEFARKLRAKGDPAARQPAGKAFIDSLYED